MARIKTSETKFLELKNLINSGSELELPVVSNSMEPLIPTGSLILVKYCSKPKLFDIIVFRQRSLLICHFIKGINPSSLSGRKVYITGNLVSLESEDLPVYDEDLLGLVVNYRLTFILKLKVALAKIFTRR